MLKKRKIISVVASLTFFLIGAMFMGNSGTAKR